MAMPTLITFALYFVVLLLIGLYFCRPNDSIVAYAWGGFGAAFGPVILFALFSKRTTWQAALTGMVTGTTVLVVWKLAGWSEHLYEIVPGFVANSAVILLVNRVIRQENALVRQRFDEVVRTVRDLRRGLTGGEPGGVSVAREDVSPPRRTLWVVSRQTSCYYSTRR